MDGRAYFWAGLIFSHYTTVYIFFISLLVAYMLGRAYERYSDKDLGWSILLKYLHLIVNPYNRKI